MKFTKSKDGRYFWTVERVWNETFDQMFLPFWAERFGDRLKDSVGKELPKEPSPAVIKDLMSGAYSNRVQKNRVGCFDQTFTLSKSVSILCYGLTSPSGWSRWSQMLHDRSKPIVEEYLNRLTIRQGAGGKDQIPAVGCAIGFVHYKNFYGDPHGHVHYAIPNMAVTKDGQIGSIGNMREVMRESGLHRAMFQKGIDDELQSRGFKTIRVGKYVEVDGIPKRMAERLSTGRRAIRSLKSEKGFDSSRAHDFYAREARRIAKSGLGDPNPNQMHERVTRLASIYGVDIDSLRRNPESPPPKSDVVASRSVAFDVAHEALDASVAKFGFFTREQYLEQLYTLGIGRPTTSDDLKLFGEALLERQQRLESQEKSFRNENEKARTEETSKRSAEGDSTNREKTRAKTRTEAKEERFATAQSEEAEKKIFASKGFVSEAWKDLKESFKNLGKAVFVETSNKMKTVIDRLTEMVDPKPNVMRITRTDAEKLARTHLPTPYLMAHAKAILKGLIAPGNPTQRAGAAEQIYKKLRSHQRLPRNTVLVVDQKLLGSPKLLNQITKIAKRDNASLVMVRAEFTRDRSKTMRPKSHSRERDL